MKLPMIVEGKFRWVQVSDLVPMRITRHGIAFCMVRLVNNKARQQDFLIQGEDYTMWESLDDIVLLNKHGVTRIGRLN